MTALYQIWVGSKQKELDANSSQLLHAYTPQATVLLAILVPIFEPMGWEVPLGDICDYPQFMLFTSLLSKIVYDFPLY